MSKMSPVLRDKLAGLPLQEPVDVIVELGSEAIDALDNAGSMDEMREIFASITRPVKAKIQSLGGNVTGEGWLNGTLQASLTKHGVECLENEQAIACVDLPRSLAREH